MQYSRKPGYPSARAYNTCVCVCLHSVCDCCSRTDGQLARLTGRQSVDATIVCQMNSVHLDRLSAIKLHYFHAPLAPPSLPSRPNPHPSPRLQITDLDRLTGMANVTTAEVIGQDDDDDDIEFMLSQAESAASHHGGGGPSVGALVGTSLLPEVPDNAFERTHASPVKRGRGRRRDIDGPDPKVSRSSRTPHYVCICGCVRTPLRVYMGVIIPHCVYICVYVYIYVYVYI